MAIKRVSATGCYLRSAGRGFGATSGFNSCLAAQDGVSPRQRCPPGFGKGNFAARARCLQVTGRFTSRNQVWFSTAVLGTPFRKRCTAPLGFAKAMQRFSRLSQRSRHIFYTFFTAVGHGGFPRLPNKPHTHRGCNGLYGLPTGMGVIKRVAECSQGTAKGKPGCRHLYDWTTNSRQQLPSSVSHPQGTKKPPSVLSQQCCLSHHHSRRDLRGAEMFRTQET